MKNGKGNNRKLKDGVLQGFIYLSAALTVTILLIIIGFILYRGLPGINMNFLTRQWEDNTTFVNVQKVADAKQSNDPNYVASLGITLAEEKTADGSIEIVITKIDSNSPIKNAVDMKKNSYPVKKHDIIGKIGHTNVKDITADQAVAAINQESGLVRLKVTRPGGGIKPMLISTIYIIILSLIIAAPIGICSAIYLNEYAKAGRVLRIIRFAIQNLAGIPSIIYGLFGMLVFVQMLKMQYSILAGALTLSIMLLPTIISTTEEALKEIPKAYRESSLGLGATKLQTISKIILPGALPGILVAVILSIGRIVGESAALIWTAGTVAQIPRALVGNEASAATLTTKMYWLIKETADLNTASSIAVVLLALIIFLNFVSKMVTRRYLRRKGN